MTFPEKLAETADDLYGEYGDAEPNIKCFKAGAEWAAKELK